MRQREILNVVGLIFKDFDPLLPLLVVGIVVVVVTVAVAILTIVVAIIVVVVAIVVVGVLVFWSAWWFGRGIVPSLVHERQCDSSTVRHLGYRIL